ncbi:MAG: mannose-1-phosphate guanylyltransferase [Caulobacterales bacterium RIFOXYB1_FULL_67_16]|nr:MAG: mannose-1-phosphate guanylyltransferase [Caulobacterales bacterium RIFOXYB1_FULL_67_16]
MCGGSGTRLWPASRPSRPKQFILLAGNRSLFQDAVERVAPLAQGGGRLIVVGGAVHLQAIREQLAAIGRSALILLEPEGRDSAAAMAAAACWTQAQDAEAINLFVASDHHIPDDLAFQKAAAVAAEAAAEGRMVTLGIVPTQPSSAYGYIAPLGEGLSEVTAFVEKPDLVAAAQYIRDGYLWNSGNFVVRADVLQDEIAAAASGLIEAVSDALAQAVVDGDAVFLGRRFADAPRISIDYAVMEKTRRASVLPVDFTWSDLGAWDTVHASGEGDVGLRLFEDAENCLVRAGDGVMVAAIGVSNLAIVVEQDAVLVTDLRRSHDVKKVVERLRTVSPRHLDFPRPAEEPLAEGAVRLAAWMRQDALPTWCTLGQNDEGGFEDLLGQDGRRLGSAHSAGVQARQIQVYAEAGRLGWSGPWQAAIRGGLEWSRRVLDPDGLMRARLAPGGEAMDDRICADDQAQLLVALASVAQVAPDLAPEQAVLSIRDRLLDLWPIQGDLQEMGEDRLQAKACMRLLEASIAWEAVEGAASWAGLADRAADLAVRRFIDPDSGHLLEPEGGAPMSGLEGAAIEPGLQFRWAWLLARHARARDQQASLQVALRLFDAGLYGVDPRRGVAIEAMTADSGVRNARARLRPQAEWLKASLALASLTDDGRREQCLVQAARAQRALWRYLSPSGLWRDKMLESGKFIDEPAPAGSLHPIMGAFVELRTTLGLLKPDMASSLELW